MFDCSYEKYPFLKELGIKPENLGAYYDGKWHSTSQHVLKTINPANEELIAITHSASV